jgi:hypothetical protein
MIGHIYTLLLVQPGSTAPPPPAPPPFRGSFGSSMSLYQFRRQPEPEPRKSRRKRMIEALIVTRAL